MFLLVSLFFILTFVVEQKNLVMSRLSEAMFMANCSSKEWNKYSKTHGDNEMPFYLSAISRDEAKRLRNLAKTKKNS